MTEWNWSTVFVGACLPTPISVNIKLCLSLTINCEPNLRIFLVASTMSLSLRMGLPSALLRPRYRNVGFTNAIVRSSGMRFLGSAKGASEHKVILDNQTLYVDQSLAEALGWKPNSDAGPIQLSLNGWAPTYFTITPTGSDSGRSIVV